MPHKRQLDLLQHYRLRQMSDAGVPQQTIADKFGVSVATVRVHIKSDDIMAKKREIADRAEALFGGIDDGNSRAVGCDSDSGATWSNSSPTGDMARGYDARTEERVLTSCSPEDYWIAMEQIEEAAKAKGLDVEELVEEYL